MNTHYYEILRIETLKSIENLKLLNLKNIKVNKLFFVNKRELNRNSLC